MRSSVERQLGERLPGNKKSGEMVHGKAHDQHHRREQDQGGEHHVRLHPVAALKHDEARPPFAPAHSPMIAPMGANTAATRKPEQRRQA